jgi:hypothetical protein
LLFLAGCGGVVAFHYFVVPATGVRHRWHIFLAFLAGAWLATARDLEDRRMVAQGADSAGPGAPGRLRTVRGWALVGFFALQAAVGIWASALDLVRPFSTSRAAAEFLQEKGLDRLAMLGHVPYVVSPVSGRLHKPIYYPLLAEWSTYNSQDPSKGHPVGMNTFLAVAAAMIVGDPAKLSLDQGSLDLLTGSHVARGGAGDMVFILGGFGKVAPPDSWLGPPPSFPIGRIVGQPGGPGSGMRIALPGSDGEALTFDFILLASFPNAVVPDETYFIYLGRRAPSR